MKNTNWRQTAKDNRLDPVVVKLTKKIKINILLWTLAFLVLAAVASVLTWLAVSKEWENPKKLIAITIPWVATAILLAMDIIVILGNKVGVMEHNGQQIIFYSGINTNMLYVDGILTTKGSSEDKLRCSLNNDYILDIVFKLVDFDIVIRKRSEIEAEIKAREAAAKGDVEIPAPTAPEQKVDLVVDVENKTESFEKDGIIPSEQK